MPNTKKEEQILTEKAQILLPKKEFLLGLALKTKKELYKLEEQLTEEMDTLALSIIDKKEKLKILKERTESVRMSLAERELEKDREEKYKQAKELINSL